ncbi:unnamed protein product [Sphagnum jensenii]|uniref:DNA repair protein RAD4 n=1 Tax=Sphagnum jensenii TaxID=128206 RepID=A0ABP0WAT8_9BRYO
MKTRESSSKAAAQRQSGFEEQLRNLHGKSNVTANSNQDATPAAAGSSLANASQHTVNQLLSRVGERQEAVRKRKASVAPKQKGSRQIHWNTTEDCKDDLFQQHPFCSKGSVAGADIPTEAVAQVAATQELEQHQQPTGSITPEIEIKGAEHPLEEDEFDWEDGDNGMREGIVDENKSSASKGWNGEVIFDSESTPANDPEKQRSKSSVRRATANDKIFSAQVHKAHLLCLLARGRLISSSCDDQLLQGSLISVLPSQLLAPIDTEKVLLTQLEHLVSWFRSNFRLLTPGEGSSRVEGISVDCLEKRLSQVLQDQAGSAEELSALSVALFRGLGFTTRYVMVLDVSSLKPDAESLEASVDYEPNLSFQDINIGTVRRSSRKVVSRGTDADTKDCEALNSEIVVKAEFVGELGMSSRENMTGMGSEKRVSLPNDVTDGGASLGSNDAVAGEPSEQTPSKRRGDAEFELELARALAATAAAAAAVEGGNEPIEVSENGTRKDISARSLEQEPRSKSVLTEGRGGGNAAIWSRKMGPLLHWAEVYCGEGDTGRWVHVDAARGVVDGAEKVEGAAAACRLPLRYVVAFAGSGAKDITRRYVTHWSTIAPLRVDAAWWDATLRPLKHLEAAATAGPSTPQVAEGLGVEGLKGSMDGTCLDFPRGKGLSDHRSSLEDMEMDTKTYMEPLPTNQQAYKTHHLYVLERWLNKYETLHPKGPVLGFCAGLPVYPRTCVQTLHTPDRWLREGRKVKQGETPVKIVKSRATPKEGTTEVELDLDEGSTPRSMTALFGRWQTEAWQPAHAVGGIVPRNERGQVDVWSEKCIPPGTVHLRFPRLVPVAQRLKIDFAPAMVGFEIRRGKSVPVYEGIVVCEEFKEKLMEAYLQAEMQRDAELLRKRVDQAMARWRQLLHSVATRQRLRATYEAAPIETAFQKPHEHSREKIEKDMQISAGPSYRNGRELVEGSAVQNCEEAVNTGRLGSNSKEAVDLQKSATDPQHVHEFPEENQSYDEDRGMRTKWCICGFSIEVEEM